MMVGLICTHVGREGHPVNLVSHPKPQDLDDSGWLLACGKPGHWDKDWMVVDVEPLLDQDLRDLMEHVPVNHRSFRESEGWTIEPIPDETIPAVYRIGYTARMAKKKPGLLLRQPEEEAA